MLKNKTKLFHSVFRILELPVISSVRSVQSLSRVQLFVTPWIAACQASLSITNSRSLLKLMSIESVMPSSHLILCRPLLLLPPIPPSIRVFSNESAVCMRYMLPNTEALIFFNNFIYLFGSAKSSFPHRLFCTSGEQGLLSSCGGQASHCSGFSCCSAWVRGLQ